MSEDRWVHVATSGDRGDQPLDVGAVARSVALDALAGRRAAAVLVHVDWHLDLQAVVDAVCDVAGDAVVVGSSTGTVLPRGAEHPADLVVTALGGPGLAARGALSTAADPVERGREVAAHAHGLGRAHTTVVLVPAGTTFDQEEVVRGVYAELGPEVVLVGGGSDGDLLAHRSWQSLGRRVVENGLVGLALGTDAPLGVGAAHGLRRAGEGLVVTDSDGLVVTGLDGRPALEVYLERLALLGVDVPADLGPAELVQLAHRHPLGLARRRRDVPRTIIAVDADASALHFVSSIPSGSLVHVLVGGEEEMLEGAREACEEAVAALDAPPAGLLVFSCIARRALLSEHGVRAENAAARAAAGGDDVVVTYSCGEFVRVRGSAGAHNQTVVALAL